MKSSAYYFHMKTKILVDFQIYISVPLRALSSFVHAIKSISNTATPCCIDFGKKLHQVNLLTIINLYLELLYFLTVIKNAMTFRFLWLCVHGVCGLVIKLFVIKRISRSLNNFTRENERCYVSFPIPYIWASLSRSHQTVIIMIHY